MTQHVSTKLVNFFTTKQYKSKDENLFLFLVNCLNVILGSRLMNLFVNRVDLAGSKTRLRLEKGNHPILLPLAQSAVKTRLRFSNTLKSPITISLYFRFSVYVLLIIKNRPVFSKSESPTMTDYRGYELHEIQHMHMNDIISNLPDCILHHILSFMPTKEVVKTSILSTRWKNLWASVPNIDFDDALLYASEVDGRHPPEVTSFMNFVERVLRLRDASNIVKFRLSCRVCFNASQIHSWIHDAIMHNVQELDLCLFAEDPSVIPKSMFDSKSLVSLKIEMDCVVELPSRISFPLLRILHLSLVTFPNDESTEKLFSDCPVLEELVLLDCEWMNLKNIAISSSTLKRLSIDDLPYFGPLDDPSGCKIKINTENLTFLEYIGYLSNEIFLDDVSSLVKACIHIPNPHERQKEVVCRTVDLLKGLRYVEYLKVSNSTLEYLICADNWLDRFPVFSNMSHLVLTMEIQNHTVGVLMDLLNLCPSLQSIRLSEGFEPCMRLGENHSIWSSIPICMSNCLKTVTFKNFCGNDSEICFVKCVLKYAHVLESMDLQCCKSQLRDIKKQRDVRKELETIARTSAACVLKLS